MSRFSCALLVAACATLAAQPFDTTPVPRHAMAPDRAFPRRPRDRGGGHPRQCRHLLHGHARRRPLENHRRRRGLDAHLRFRAGLLHRRGGRRAVQPQYRLLRHRRRQHGRRLGQHGQWRLQVHRRREDLAAYRTGRDRAHRHLWVDPHNPDIVLVAALGRTYSKNNQRGVFKTTDGGKTWRNVLHKDDVTGAVDLVFAPGNTRDRLCRAVGTLHGARRARRHRIDRLRRRLQDYRQRRHMDAAHRRLAWRTAGPHRRGRGRGWAESVRHRGRWRRIRRGRWRRPQCRRPLPLRRRRRALEQEHAGSAHSGQRLFQPRVSRSQELRRGVCGADFALPLRRMAATRSPRTKARPAATTITRCGSTRPTASA